MNYLNTCRICQNKITEEEMNYRKDKIKSFYDYLVYLHCTECLETKKNDIYSFADLATKKTNNDINDKYHVSTTEKLNDEKYISLNNDE